MILLTFYNIIYIFTEGQLVLIIVPADYQSFILMKYTDLQVLVTILIICSADSQPCTPTEAIANIQTGGFILLHNYFIDTNFSTQKFPVNFEIKDPQIFISVYQISNFNPRNGLDFKFEGRKESGKNYVQIDFFYNQKFIWSSIKVSYMVSENDQFILGNYPFQPNSIEKIIGQERELIINLPQYRLAPKTKYTASIFLSGIITKKSVFNFRIFETEVFEQNETLMIRFYQDRDSSIEWVNFQYIVYEVKHDILNLQTVGGDFKVAGIVSIDSSNFQIKQLMLCERGFKSFCEQDQIIWNGTCFCLNQKIKNYAGVCVDQCPENEQRGLVFCECIDEYVRDESGKCHRLVQCGNLIIEAQEQCDDGNMQNGDGCDENCQIERKISLIIQDTKIYTSRISIEIGLSEQIDCISSFEDPTLQAPSLISIALTQSSSQAYSFIRYDAFTQKFFGEILFVNPRVGDTITYELKLDKNSMEECKKNLELEQTLSNRVIYQPSSE